MHSQQDLIFLPTRILAGQDLPEEIRVESMQSTQIQTLEVGDFAVLAISRDQGRYRLNGPAIEVNSPDPTKANIVGPLSGHIGLVSQRFIHSCGGDRHFSMLENAILVDVVDRNDFKTGQKIPIATYIGTQWQPLANTPPICRRVQSSWWRQFTGFFRELLLM